ncbi:MAG: hypothetical protein ACK4FG_00975 [Brevundimonas sp.]
MNFRLATLKAFNLALSVGWSFSFVAVLSRALGMADYAYVALVSGLGAYVMSANLGLPALVYSRVREEYLVKAGESGGALAVCVSSIFSAAAVIATLAFSLWIILFSGLGVKFAIDLLILFAGMALNLPLMVLKAICSSIDRYWEFESAETVRRSISLGLVLTVLGGASLKVYAICYLLITVMVVVVALFMAKSTFISGVRYLKDSGIRGVFARDSKSIGGNIWFSLNESALYNSPYFLIPIVFGVGAEVILFDVFARVSRFGAAAYLAVSESAMPRLSEANNSGARAKVRGIMWASAGACLPVVIGGCLVVAADNGAVLEFLVSGLSVTLWAVLSICLTLSALMAQTLIGNFLLSTGQVARALPISMFSVWALVALYAAVAVFSLGGSAFLVGYAGIFCISAACYVWSFFHALNSSRK